MKKSTLLIAAMAFTASAAFAQDLTSKKGETFLPESGDWLQCPCEFNDR